MKKLKKLIQQKEFFKDLIGQYEIEISSYIWSYSDLDLFDLLILQKKSQGLKYKIKNIEWKSSPLPDMHYDVYFDKQKNINSNRTGLYKISFADNSYLYFIFWRQNIESGDFYTLLVGNKEDLYKLRFIRNKTVYKINKPQAGFARAKFVNSSFGGYELRYDYLQEDELPNVEVYHPEHHTIKQDIDNFFKSNGELYNKYNKPKVRKVLLTGEPGTGKTIISTSVSRAFHKKIPVVFVNDLKSMIEHFHNVHKYSMPSIIIFEDCERSLKEIDSYHLNFLDGINQPLHKKGVYIIFTTNFPHIIEDRIVKRPGRIDKIFTIDSLKGKYALNCARYYFQDIINLSDAHTNIFHNLTGAQISSLVHTSVLSALGENKSVTIETIEESKREMLKAIKELEKNAKRYSFENQASVGFSSKMNDTDTPF